MTYSGLNPAPPSADGPYIMHLLVFLLYPHFANIFGMLLLWIVVICFLVKKDWGMEYSIEGLNIVEYRRNEESRLTGHLAMFSDIFIALERRYWN